MDRDIDSVVVGGLEFAVKNAIFIIVIEKSR